MNQKKAILSLLCLSLLAAALPASYGFKGGVTVSRFDYPDTVVGTTAKDLLGFCAGLVAVMPAGEQFAFRIELLYSQKGHEAEVVGPFGGEWKTTLDYIELPVLLQLAVPLSESVRPVLFAGGYGAYLVSAKLGAEESEDVDVKDSFKEFDYGAVLGAGLEFRIGEKNKLLLDARYNLGLAKIDAEGSDVKNRGFAFSAGILF